MINKNRMYRFYWDARSKLIDDLAMMRRDGPLYRQYEQRIKLIDAKIDRLNLTTPK